MLSILKSKLENENISNEGIAVLLALNGIYCDGTTYVNLNQLCYTLTGKLGNKRLLVEKVRSGLEELINNNYVIEIDVVKNEYVLRYNVINKESYALVNENEVHTIMNLSNIDTFQLLRYFLTVIGTINESKRSGWQTINALSDLALVHKNNALRYNQILEQLKLLYIHRFDKVLYDKDEETFKKLSNTYGRYTDREFVVACAEIYHDQVTGALNQDHDNNEPINTRSISARYNSYIRGISSGKIYDEAFVMALKKDCIKYNKYYDGYSEKLKDMSVFPEYKPTSSDMRKLFK